MMLNWTNSAVLSVKLRTADETLHEDVPLHYSESWLIILVKEVVKLVKSFVPEEVHFVKSTRNMLDVWVYLDENQPDVQETYKEH